MKILLIFPLPSHSSCVEEGMKTVLLKHNQHNNNNNDDNEIVQECGEKA